MLGRADDEFDYWIVKPAPFFGALALCLLVRFYLGLSRSHAMTIQRRDGLLDC